MRTCLAVGAVVIIATAIVACGSSSAPKLQLAREGARAPTFDVSDIRDPGRRITLAEFRGRPIVLNFWASWCVPCRNEMPLLETVHRRFGDRVVFLGMNHQDTRDEGLKLLRKTGVTYLSGYDPEGAIATAYRLFGMPTTVFISADGRLLAKRSGELHGNELADTVAKLFGVHAD